MTDSWRHAAQRVATELSTIFGSRLRSVVAYGAHLDGQTDGPLTCLALVDSLAMSDLDGCAARAGSWHRARIATPLILPVDEFRQSLDAFPLEYGEILRAHHTVFGDDILKGVSIAPADLRRACEAQVKSHLLHLREEYMEAGNDPRAKCRRSCHCSRSMWHASPTNSAMLVSACACSVSAPISSP